MRRDQPIIKNCWICNEPLPLSKGSRHRLTCSDKCRATRSRRLKGQMGWVWKRRKKEIDRKRALPFVERTFDGDTPQPIHVLGERRSVYECVTCGKTYLVERLRSREKASPYCSDACRKNTQARWKRFQEALDRVYYAGEKVHPRVLVRLEHQKLSPLCPRCKNPFAPRTWLDGRRKGGRPRKYCSDSCRKAAYEQRWKNEKGRPRRHRFWNCLECGERFDREDTLGRRAKRFCSKECTNRFAMRAYQVRLVAREKGQTVFKYGASGRQGASRGATKHKRGSAGWTIPLILG